MTNRDIATITFKALAAWLFASGVAGMCSALLTWGHDVGQYGKEVSIMSLAAAAVFIPIGAMGWLVSDWAAHRVFRGRAEPVSLGLNRADLYAFASVLVGLSLLADALPQVVYWLVVWRMSRGIGFWSAAPLGAMDNSVVSWVAARAQIGSVVAKATLGLILVFGPERIRSGLFRIRREFAGHIAEPEAEADTESRKDDGGA